MCHDCSMYYGGMYQVWQQSCTTAIPTTHSIAAQIYSVMTLVFRLISAECIRTLIILAKWCVLRVITLYLLCLIVSRGRVRVLHRFKKYWQFNIPCGTLLQSHSATTMVFRSRWKSISCWETRIPMIPRNHSQYSSSTEQDQNLSILSRGSTRESIQEQQTAWWWPQHHLPQTIGSDRWSPVENTMFLYQWARLNQPHSLLYQQHK